MEWPTGHGVNLMADCKCEYCADATEVAILTEKVLNLEYQIEFLARKLADTNEQALIEWLG